MHTSGDAPAPRRICGVEPDTRAGEELLDPVQALQDADGNTYYYNSATGVTGWSREEADRQRTLIDRAGLPIRWPDLDPESVLRTLQGDKKVRDGQLRFVMPTSIGNVEVRDDVSREEILRCLRG